MDYLTQHDPLTTQEFAILMKEFCMLLSRQDAILLREVSPFIEQFKRSPLLNVLLNGPYTDSASHAVTCLKNHLAKQTEVPSSFLSKFLSLCNTRLFLSPSNLSLNTFGKDINSYKVQVIPSQTYPPYKLTYQSTRELTARLNRSIEENTQLVTRNHDILHSVHSPNEVKLRFSPRLLNHIVTSLVDLYQTIGEANRRNGFEIDRYIQERSVS